MNSNKKLWEQNWNRWRHIYYPSTGLKTLLPISASTKENLACSLDNVLSDKSSVFFLPESDPHYRHHSPHSDALCHTLMSSPRSCCVQSPSVHTAPEDILCLQVIPISACKAADWSSTEADSSLTLTQCSCGYNWPQLNPTPKWKAKRFKA